LTVSLHVNTGNANGILPVVLAPAIAVLENTAEVIINRVVTSALVFMAIAPLYGLRTTRQPGDLGVRRGVFLDFSEESRTRGFPSPPFGRFGFVGDVH
jgi:hypothetical protein